MSVPPQPPPAAVTVYGNGRGGHAAVGKRGRAWRGPAGAPSPDGPAPARLRPRLLFTNVLGGCGSLGVGAGRGRRRRGWCFGGNCEKGACVWPCRCPETSRRLLPPPRAGPPLCTALEPHPRSLGVAFLWPLAAWHQHLSGQLRGSRRCETAGRHGTELNLLGAGEKLTWQGPNHPPNLRPPPHPGSLGSAGGRACLVLGALCTPHWASRWVWAPILGQGELGPKGVGWELPGGGGAASDAGLILGAHRCLSSCSCGSWIQRPWLRFSFSGRTGAGEGGRGGEARPESAELRHPRCLPFRLPLLFCIISCGAFGAKTEL